MQIFGTKLGRAAKHDFGTFAQTHFSIIFTSFYDSLIISFARAKIGSCGRTSPHPVYSVCVCVFIPTTFFDNMVGLKKEILLLLIIVTLSKKNLLFSNIIFYPAGISISFHHQLGTLFFPRH